MVQADCSGGRFLYLRDNDTHQSWAPIWQPPRHALEDKVTVEARVAVERWGEVSLVGVVRITAPDGAAHEERAAIAVSDEVTIIVPITHLQL